MDIFTAIITAVVSICSTLGISKFFRTREEKSGQQIDNSQKALDILSGTLDKVNSELLDVRNRLEETLKDNKDLNTIIVRQATENKDLAVKLTKLELLYCDTKECVNRKNPYRNCAECPESDTCVLKNMHERIHCDIAEEME